VGVRGPTPRKDKRLIRPTGLSHPGRHPKRPKLISAKRTERTNDSGLCLNPFFRLFRAIGGPSPSSRPGMPYPTTTRAPESGHPFKRELEVGGLRPKSPSLPCEMPLSFPFHQGPRIGHPFRHVPVVGNSLSRKSRNPLESGHPFRHRRAAQGLRRRSCRNPLESGHPFRPYPRNPVFFQGVFGQNPQTPPILMSGGFFGGTTTEERWGNRLYSLTKSLPVDLRCILKGYFWI